MEKELASLTTVQSPFQQSVIEGILKDAGIHFVVRDSSPLAIYAPGLSTLSTRAFWVPSERLQEAKDVLCANGVMCEVSPRLLSRSLNEIVKPLLAQEGLAEEELDLSRLARFVEINNKETVRALFEATLRETGGRELLERLFFSLAREGSSGLRPLARALSKAMNAAFGDRFQTEVSMGDKEVRLTLLEVLPELPPGPARTRALVAGLRDRDAEIREAASEALFALGTADFGYDPEDPPAEREAAVRKILALQGLD